MTTRMTPGTTRAKGTTAPRFKTMTARALLFALSGCLNGLVFASAAEAAPFQQYRNGICTAAAICNIDFPVVPTGKRLEITNVSCYLRTSGTYELKAMQLLVIKPPTTFNAVTLEPSFTDSVSNPFEEIRSSNHTIFAFANAGQRFQAYAELKKGTYSQFACHISGQMLSAKAATDLAD